MANGNPIVESALHNTIQSNVTTDSWSSPISLLMLMAKSADIISPWWSPRRDMELRNFIVSSDHVSGAMYNMVAKMTTIPVKIVARDNSIKAHVEMASRLTESLLGSSQFGEGWASFYGRMVYDLFSQDNGTFVEIIGPGPKDGPLTGLPISVAHLDAARCTRTGNAEYPVLYQSSDGRLYKLHYTRVIFGSQLPSTRYEMNGVGMCAVSRVINAAQNLYDISIYKQEKLGSRPNRQLIVTGGGLDPDDIQTAVRLSENSMNNQGLSRFSKTIVAGNRSIPDPKLNVVDLAKVPDGFDEKESTILGMAVISMGFGIDARELFPAMESGATKADAIVQHIKQRGKGPGQTIVFTETQFNTKCLPSFLKMVFDYQDDQQDRQNAEINSVRAQTRERDLGDSVTTIRVERERMVDHGEITDEQFEQMELEDGRLEDGVTVDVLFESKDKEYVEFLSDVNESNYEKRKKVLMGEVINSRDVERIKKARRAIAAIEYRFENEDYDTSRGAEQLATTQTPTTDTRKPTKPDDSYQEEQFGRKLPRQTVRIPDEENNYVGGKV